MYSSNFITYMYKCTGTVHANVDLDLPVTHVHRLACRALHVMYWHCSKLDTVLCMYNMCTIEMALTEGVRSECGRHEQCKQSLQVVTSTLLGNKCRKLSHLFRSDIGGWRMVVLQTKHNWTFSFNFVSRIRFRRRVKSERNLSLIHI